MEQQQQTPRQAQFTHSSKWFRIFRFIRDQLTNGTTIINFVFYLIAALFTIAFFVFFNFCQTFVLSQILKETQVSAGSTLVLYDQILSIFLLGIWGTLSDKIGTRIVYCVGFVLMGLSMLLYTFAQNVYPQLLLMRLLFGMGASATSSMVTAVLAEYITEYGRGRISGIVGLITGIGALSGALGLSRLPTIFHAKGKDLVYSLRLTYLICGGISICVAVLLAFFLKPHKTVSEVDDDTEEREGVFISPKDENSQKGSNESMTVSVDGCPHMFVTKDGVTVEHVVGGPSPERCTMPGYYEAVGQNGSQKKKSFWALVLEGFYIALEKPYIMLAYFGGFVARGDSIVVTLFLSAWIDKYYRDNQLCNTDASGDLENPLKKCAEAFTMSSTYSGIAQSLALVFAPVFGYLCDKIGRSKAFLFAAVLSFCGYFPFWFVTNPVRNIAVYLLMCLVGIGEIGMIVTSLSLATAKLPNDIRGSVSGCYSLFGGLGVLVLTYCGGLLADYWILTAPFVLVSFFTLAIIVGTIIIIYREAYYGTYELVSPII
ncbi:hypothetical protein MP638_007208 [Amoeboaphelidium occidentale]|nr:hypothetical protein MP638_007208 [Amoeboaphelidium occidentale]